MTGVKVCARRIYPACRVSLVRTAGGGLGRGEGVMSVEAVGVFVNRLVACLL